MVRPTLSEIDPPLGAAITCQLSGVPFDWGKTTHFPLDDSLSLTTSHSISRHLGRLNPTLDLYPINILHRTEIDHWLTLSSGPLGCKNEISSVLCQLNKALAPSVFVTAEKFTIADIELFSTLFKCNEWHQKVINKSAPAHVLRWYNHVSRKVEGYLSSFPASVTLTRLPTTSSSTVGLKGTGTKREEGGKFVELPGAKVGEVVVRFPPEASGYLHIGHAKAALLNQYYQKEFKGKLIMRFDDTNPAKEDAEFERVILEDLKLLEVEADIFTHTSDYFDKMLGLCENLIKEGKAYADDTDPETMKKERDERKQSTNWNNTVEKNLKMWSEMKNGTEYGQSCCIRAKIDMNSPNGCMRDPTIYRCKNEPHIRTGYKYKVYPTYDFACPIVDSIEGVTHALRTTEYHDRDDQYYWFIKNLSLRSLHIYEYSRLNMNNTVLSKRKLTWFVKEGLVEGWDDPRFPTVRGILRRGMTIEGLKDFIISQGSSRSVVNMEWDKIWAFNKKVIDKEASRYTALQGELIPVNVINAKEESKLAQRHPKDTSKGMKTIWVGPKILIEAEDAAILKEGENATFINWGNLNILKIEKNGNKIVSVEAETNLSNEDFKKTSKLTWLPETSKAFNTPVVCVYFDHLISKSVLGKDEDFKNFIPANTRKETRMIGDDELKHLKKDQIIQLQRKGFFRVDEEYKPFSSATCKETPIVLIYIPDGHSKETPSTVSSKPGNAMSNKIRNLKSSRADKSLINPEVEILKTLKSKFKDATGLEWMPELDLSQFTKETSPVKSKNSGANSLSNELHEKIKAQGDKIRTLKAGKASKAVISSEVDILKKLKAEFKDSTGVEWNTEIDISQLANGSSTVNIEIPGTNSMANELHTKIKAQSDKMSTLKAVVTLEGNILTTLKAKFKDATGVEWMPEIDISQLAIESSSANVKSPGTISMANVLHDKIKAQGNKIRTTNSSKGIKAKVNLGDDILQTLRAKFIDSVGIEPKPEIDISPFENNPSTVNVKISEVSSMVNELHEKIKAQGDKIRTLKSNKADKVVVTSEVDILKSLKVEFKDATQVEWKPELDISLLSCIAIASKESTGAISCVERKLNCETENNASSCSKNFANAKEPVKVKRALSSDNHALVLLKKIEVQGDKIRNLKSTKADVSAIMQEVDSLKMLKSEFKDATGVEWKVDIDMNQFTEGSSPSGNACSIQVDNCNNISLSIHEMIVNQGTEVRNLKNQKADKNILKSELDKLLQLKKDFKTLTNTDWKPDIDPSTLSSENFSLPKEDKSTPKKQIKKPSPPKLSLHQEDVAGKKQTRLGLEVKKDENFSAWYSQVLTKSEMMDYYNISGCYILRPGSYEIWDFIKSFLDTEINKLGVKNSYFPMFVSKDALEKEKTHIADFSPEVAWVTRSGSSEMAEPVAIRPTSETVMYPSFAKWIKSHRSLPFKLNQWNNVVRWEFKQPTPFLRSREFLWQEGHTAFATKKEATDEVYTILDLYTRVYEELLAVPVVKGRKTEKEKFAGGDFTTTTEAYIRSSGRAIQGATSHHLGQNFSKMFNIVFEDPKTLEEQYVFQNSWGLTTRSIGVMVMVHGDDKGLVLPPRVASVQVIIMPVGITSKSTEADKDALTKSCNDLMSQLTNGGIRAFCDLDDNVTPAWKFNHWELKGAPLRIELGPREVTAGQVFTVRRDNGEKQSLARNNIVCLISNLLDTIQNSMFQKALVEANEHKTIATTWSSFICSLEKGNLILMPFCGNEDCEDAIKKDSAKEESSKAGAPSMGAKGLCIPFEQPGSVEGLKCIHPKCSKKPMFYTLFGRSY